MIKNYFSIIIILLCNTTSFTQEIKLKKLYADKNKSDITYAMNHPLHSWIGVSSDILSVILLDTSTMDINELAVVVKIASFDSKNSNRDSNTIEVTEALKYPNVSLSSNSIKQVNDKLTVKGTLKFHGVSKEIIFDVQKEIIKDKIKVTGNFEILMTDFKIKPPKLLGIATNKDIKLSFTVFYKL
jgi:polyisoprenoid-binding protein YceI